MRILALSGSLRRGSHNTALLRAAAQATPPGAALELYERLHRVPPFDEDVEARGWPAPVRDLRASVERADALLLATPEYNFSVPGQLKNAIDWLSRPLHAGPLREKPAAVIGASMGVFGAVWAQAELRKVLGASGALVVPAELAVGVANEAFGDDGSLRRPEQRQQLGAVVADLVSAVRERRDELAA